MGSISFLIKANHVVHDFLSQCRRQLTLQRGSGFGDFGQLPLVLG